MEPKLRLLRPADLVVCAVLLCFLPISWAVPERHWHRLAKRLLWIGSYWRSHSASVRQQRIEQALRTSAFSRSTPRELDRQIGVNWIVRQFQILRSYRPGRWRPQIELAGREHLDAALSKGRGAVLWCSTFAFDPIVTKMALHCAGYAISHLSTRSHGYADSRFAMHFLNPIMVHVENRYLQSRVVIDQGPSGAMDRLRAAVRGNGVVTIVAVSGASRRPAVVPFMGCELPIGMGAPNLAHEEGAALLPLFTFRRPDDTYLVLIEPELPVDRTLSRLEAARQAVEAYVGRLERHVVDHPDQWRAWDTLTLGN